MNLSSQVITTYGESITVGGSSAKGFLSVINKSNSAPKTNSPSACFKASATDS